MNLPIIKGLIKKAHNLGWDEGFRRGYQIGYYMAKMGLPNMPVHSMTKAEKDIDRILEDKGF